MIRFYKPCHVVFSAIIEPAKNPTHLLIICRWKCIEKYKRYIKVTREEAPSGLVAALASHTFMRKSCRTLGESDLYSRSLPRWIT